MHARHTRELIVDRLPAGHGQRRGQGAKGRPGIAQKQAGLLHWRQSGATLDLQLFARRVGASRPDRKRHAQRAQRLQHDAGVIGIQHIAQRGSTCRQRRQQQQPVADALGARHAHHAADARHRRQIKPGRTDRSLGPQAHARAPPANAPAAKLGWPCIHCSRA